MARFKLTQEQQNAVDSRNGSLLVSAAAGSGKTRVLVERLLGRVEQEELDLDRFLVITYTKAAAGELRARIGKELSARLQENPFHAFLRRQSTRLYVAQISTIHAYCASLIRDHTHQLGLNPNFRQMEESDAVVLQEQVLARVLEERYADRARFSGFAELAEMVSGSYDDKKLLEITLDIHRRIQSHPDPSAWLQEQTSHFTQLENLAQSPWAQVLLARAKQNIAYAKDLTARAREACLGDEQLENSCAPALETGLQQLGQMQAMADWDALRIELQAFSFARFKPIKNAQNPEGKQLVTTLRDLAKKQIKKATEILRDDMHSARLAMEQTAPAMQALFALIEDFSQQYAAEKLSLGTLDFGDLEHLALQLLVKDGAPTALALRESEHFAEVMVDEYQDTNAVQNAIFNAISAQGERLFMVGDVKQSIYRFRLAEPQIFLAKSKAFPLYSNPEQTGARKAVLSQNFRSRAEVLDAVNATFRAIMSEECGGLVYDEEAWLNEGASHCARDDCATEFHVINTTIDAEETEEEAKKATSPYLIEARYVAQRIDSLVKQKTLTGEGEQMRPIRYEDIAILRHSLKSTLRYIGQALDERGIPWSMEGGEEFFGTPEVEIALSLLQVVDNPHQDIPLISVLRSPVYAFTADQLAQLRLQTPSGDFYTALVAAAQAGDAASADALRDISALREEAGAHALYPFIWRLYDRTNLFGIVGSMPSGQARQGRLEALADAARSFESGGQKGLFAFLSYLETLREQGKTLQSSGSGGTGVQIKTIHRSKGLEFPIVFLMGMGAAINLSDARDAMLFHPKLGVGPKGFDPARRLRYPTLARDAVRQVLHQETKSEAMRLLYVGMTRPVEKLIMTCTMKQARNALQKLACEVTLPLAPQVIEEMDCTGKWLAAVAMTRPEGAALRADAICEIPIDPASIGAPWVISLFEGAEFEQAPTRADSPYIEEEESTSLSPSALLAQYLWEYPYAADDVASKLTATGLKGRFLDEEAQEQAPLLRPQEVLFEAPRFLSGEQELTAPQRGTALHLAMQFLDYEKATSLTSLREELARLETRQIMTPQQVAAIQPEQILRFFQTPLGGEMLQAKDLRKEFKFSVLVPAKDYYPEVSEGEQVLLQGVVDAFYEREEGIVLVDFKTDYVTQETIQVRAESYRTQLDAYTRALEQITGKQVCKRVLWFFSKNQAVEL